MVIRWGILATGSIAQRFTEDLRLVPDAEVVAVGSRTAAAAQTFAQRYAIPRAYGTWAELAADPEVDVVYVATPHAFHYAAALTCVRGGKAVLVEKPFTLDVPSSERLIEAAGQHRVFAMEAMWTRCLPAVRRLRDLLDEGAIGEVTTVRADFGVQGPFAATHRMRDPALGGGALLDLGIYPVTLAHLALGVPDTIQALAQLTPEGVDANTGLLLGYGSRTGPGRGAVPDAPSRTGLSAIAALTCGLSGDTGTHGSITGTTGRIELSAPFFRPKHLVLHRDGEATTVEAGFSGWGFHFEAAEVNRCVQAGLLESPLVPHATTLEVLGILDAVRAQLGVAYPESR
jgi:predicted dehydrogenase